MQEGMKNPGRNNLYIYVYIYTYILTLKAMIIKLANLNIELKMQHNKWEENMH